MKEKTIGQVADYILNCEYSDEDAVLLRNKIRKLYPHGRLTIHTASASRKYIPASAKETLEWIRSGIACGDTVTDGQRIFIVSKSVPHGLFSSLSIVLNPLRIEIFTPAVELDAEIGLSKCGRAESKAVSDALASRRIVVSERGKVGYMPQKKLATGDTVRFAYSSNGAEISGVGIYSSGDGGGEAEGLLVELTGTDGGDAQLCYYPEPRERTNLTLASARPSDSSRLRKHMVRSGLEWNNRLKKITPAGFDEISRYDGMTYWFVCSDLSVRAGKVDVRSSSMAKEVYPRIKALNFFLDSREAARASEVMGKAIEVFRAKGELDKRAEKDKRNARRKTNGRKAD